MLLLILESIGTPELILIGIVALILLGPRRLPEIARKAGKMMNEFRGTANEFKQTWQREVDFEEEAKAFDLNELESDVVARETPKASDSLPAAPAIKQIDPATIEEFRKREQPVETVIAEPTHTDNDKKNWL